MRSVLRRLTLPLLMLCAAAAAPDARAGDYPWEPAWASARAEQDRMIESAARKKESLENVARYYRQRLSKDGSALSHYLYGRVQGKNAQIDDSIRHMDQATKLQPDFWPAWYSLAVLYLEKQDLKRARGFLDTALRLEPEDEAGRRLLLRFHLAGQEWDRLKGTAETLLRRNSADMEARYYLALAYMGLKELKQAKYLIEKLVQANPRAVNVRMLWVECCIGLEQWGEAEKELEQLSRAFPKDLGIKEKLVEVRLNSGDAQGAVGTMREMLAGLPGDTRTSPQGLAAELQLRGLLAQTLLMVKDLPGAERELDVMDELVAKDAGLAPIVPWILRMRSFVYNNTERPEKLLDVLQRLDGIEKLSPNLLDLWQITLAKLGRHPERVPLLRRLLPFLEGRPEDRKKVETAIAAIEAGGEAPEGEPAAFGAAALAQLIERCTATDVNVRRKALFEYYQLDLPFVDPVIYHRHDPRIEPDPECRLWVVKILGRFPAGRAQDDIVRIAARYAGYALEDPDPRVRQAAASALGSIRAPAGIVYLGPQLAVLKGRLQDPPEGREDRTALERELNAVRTALRELTGRNDVAIGEEDWVRLDQGLANLEGWDAWFESEAGAAKRVEGIQDLGGVDDIDPRWQLRYVLVDVLKDKPPAPVSVAVAAYRVLRDRIQALPAAKREADPWWRSFPIFPDEKLTAPHLPEVRAAVRTWWNVDRKAGG